MSLSAGQRVAPCATVARLGAGRMGEVHRARDLRLARTLASQALPSA